jgi:hypothetical protein
LSRKIRLAAGLGDPFPTSSPYPSHVERRSTQKSSILCPLNRSSYKTQRVERSRGFKKKDEHFQKDHNGLTGRRGEVPFRTNRDNSASLSKLVGLHGSLRPCKNKRRHHPQNKHAILQNLFVETPFRGWSIMPGDLGSWPPGLTRQVVYHTTIPVL